MFTLTTHQNPWLPAGATRAEAVLTVTAGEAIAAVGDSVFGLVLDTSGSMQGENLERLQEAAVRALDLLAGETSFFVVAFDDGAKLVQALAPATPENRRLAARRIRELEAGGSTRFSRGLGAARVEVEKRPGARAHVLFLTDGKNDRGDQDSLAQELARCEGVFQADGRGLGTDWEPDQLRQIAERLLGTAEIVPAPADLERDFRATTERALGCAVGDVRLRIATPRSGVVKLTSVRQTSPRILELTGRGAPVDANTFDFPTGAWAKGESRDFLLALECAAGAVGEEMLLARPSVVAGGQATPVRGTPILAAWTARGDERSALLNSHVAHYTGQVQLSEEIRTGLAARAAGHVDKATELLGNALARAEASGNAEATVRLRELVTREADGTVSLRAHVDKAKVMDLDLSSIVTARPRRSA